MSFTFRYDLNGERLLFICKAAGLAGLRKAAYQVRKAARKEVKRSRQYSQPGTPPHTRRGQLRRSILYGVENDKALAVIGPAANLISDIASYHEYGGIQIRRRKRKIYKIGSAGPIDIRSGSSGLGGVVFTKLKNERQVVRATRLDRQLWPDGTLVKKQKYPQRPLMGPTLVNMAPSLPQYWENSLRNP
ncbi:MAG TPA: hypothetical protein PKY10_15455 [Lentisphaeria bacterium]|nr:hypothetical protein [Lentisphaeria bacterium]